jgi:hypothetical protein
MFDPGEPENGVQLRAAMRGLVTEGHEYLRAVPNPAFFAPQGDRWSPAEHIRHLRKSTAPVAQALRVPAWLLRLRFGQGARTSRDYRTLRDTYRGVLAQGGQAGRFAPSPEPAPTDSTARRAAIMRSWDAAVGALETASARWPEASLERAWLPHPLLGLLTVREMLEFTVYHTSHHLALVASRIDRGTRPEGDAPPEPR